MAKPTRQELKLGLDALRGRGFSDAEISEAARETLTTVRQETERYQPGFLERLQAGMAPTARGEANIYRGMGYDAFPKGDDVFIRTPTGHVRADPKGFDVGDIADVAGELPSIAGGTLGGLAGAGAGIWSGPGAVAAGVAGAGFGSGAGDWVRQQIAQQLGSGEGTDWGRVALEGALGAGGELGGRYVGKLLAGPFRRSRTAPDIAKTIDQVVKFDEQYGTELARLAPADVQTGSEFLGQATQRVREGQFGGQRLRETQDIPFEREVEKGFEAIRGQAGLTQRAGESEAGKGLKEAVASTLKERTEELNRLYDEFGALVNPMAQPNLSNTGEAMSEILSRDVMKRKKTGAEGLDILRNALEEAGEVATFADLVGHRKAVASEVKVWDPARKSDEVQSALQKLWGALRDDEAAFLEAGGRKSTRPGADAPPPAPTIDLDIKPAQATRAVGETLTPNQIVRGMGGLQPSELTRIKGAMDVDRGMASAIGKLRGNPGMTIEEMLENVRGSEQGDAIFRAAGIESADDFMEAIRTKSFFQKFQAGAESFERGAAREQAEAARGQIGPLFERIEKAGTVDDLQAIAREFEEARRAGVIDAEDLAVANDEINKSYQNILARTTAPATDIPDIGLPSQAAREAGQRARSYSAEMHRIDEAQPLKTLFGDDYKLSEIPEKLSGMNKDQIRVAREAIGSKGAGASLPSTEEGAAAWRNIVAEVFDDLKQKMRNPQKSKADHFVVSGDRLNTALDKFKPGALEEIFGLELAGALRNFGDMARNVNVAERDFGNLSRTNQAQQSVLYDLKNLIWGDPRGAIGSIVGRALTERGAGRLVGTEGGKRYLLGTTRLQTEHPTLLQQMGRAGAQTGVQGFQGSTGAR